MFYPDLLYSVYVFLIVMLCPINIHKFEKKYIYLNNSAFKKEIIKEIKK